MSDSAVRVRIRNRVEEMPVIADALERLAIDHQLPSAIMQQVSVALDEVVSNVIRHGFPGDGEHWIDVSLQVAEDSMVVEVKDDGIPFDPLQYRRPPPEGTLRTREIGGVGILFVCALMDRLRYRRVHNRNILRMTKRFTSLASSQRA